MFVEKPIFSCYNFIMRKNGFAFAKRFFVLIISVFAASLVLFSCDNLFTDNITSYTPPRCGWRKF